MSDAIASKRLKAHVQENGIIRIDNVKSGERNLIGRLCDALKYEDIPEYKPDLVEEPIREEVSVARAVKVLTGSILEDEDLRMGYKANIAMAFVDECKDSGGFEEIAYVTLHNAANNAAESFLNNWCYNSEE